MSGHDLDKKTPPRAQISPNQLSLILYEGTHPPRFFQFNKKKVKWALIVLPFITAVSVFLLFSSFIYFQDIIKTAQEHDPKIVQELQKTIQNQELYIEEVSGFNEKLLERLAQGENLDLSGTETLALFRPVAGMQNLTSSPQLSIENYELSRRADQLTLSFNIVNQTTDGQRLSGHLFVLMKTKSAIHIYPSSSFAGQTFQVNFTSGESFATQRFRPVENVRFSSLDVDQQTLFKVIIFSRTGDLLFKEIMPISQL